MATERSATTNARIILLRLLVRAVANLLVFAVAFLLFAALETATRSAAPESEMGILRDSFVIAIPPFFLLIVGWRIVDAVHPNPCLDPAAQDRKG